MVYKFIQATWLLALFCSLGASAQTITLQSLLQEMTNVDAVARFPQPAYQGLAASSYNRASYNRNQPDQTFGGWFADGDGTGFIRTETNALTGQTEWVMMEQTGPGCITRMWTPYFYYDYNNRVGPNVRVYLDGASQPVLDESFIKLLTAQGSIEYPFAALTARAGDLYLPIPYAQSCKVTMTQAPFYFNVAYRAYTNGTPVQTFTVTNYQAFAGLRTNVGTFLTAAPATPTGTSQTNQLHVAAGTNAVIALPAGPSAVRQFTIQLPASTTNSQHLRSLVLAMSFDGEQTIWCPIGDFFSSADSIHPFQTLQRSVTTNGTLTCSWVMPYQTSGSLQILNLGPQDMDLTVSETTAPWTWDAQSMHFHANWRSDNVVPGAPPSDWNFIDIHGQGVYVGDSWTVLNIQPNTWWGEGDEKIYVDAAWQNGFPTQFGTGSEDYYGWAGGVLPSRADEFSYPFLSNVRVGGLDGCTQGYNINTRTRALDAIPFTQRLVFDMESSFGVDIRNPWDLLGYSVATFWYALPGATNNRPPEPAAAATPILSVSQVQQMSDVIRYGHHTTNGPGARWNLGEQDTGALAGHPGNAATRDAIGTNNLSRVGTPVYSTNVPGGGSTLSMLFDGASCYQGGGGGFSNTYDGINLGSFSLSCDVYMTATGSGGFSFPVSMGETAGGGGGVGIVEIGGTWEIIHHLVAESGGGPAAVLNTWTHLELLRKDFGSGVQTRLLVNGVDAGLALSSGPNNPPPYFTIGANQNPGAAGGLEGFFNGLVDNVVLQNLSPVVASGPTVAPVSGSVTVGGSFTLSVIATGEQPLTYQWRQDGATLTNAAGLATISFTNATTNQSGGYDVIITNAYGAVTGSVVKVSVLPPTASSGNVKAQYRLGEDDLGAVAGLPGNATTMDAVGTNDLTAQGAPVYSANVPRGGSTVSMSFDGASCYQRSGAAVSDLIGAVNFNNFDLSCDVYMTAPGSAGFSFPISIGGTGGDGGGVAIVEIGGRWELIHHGVEETGNGPPVILNAWTHLDLERRNSDSGVQTRLLINGTDSGLFLDSELPGPGLFFTIGANANPNVSGGLEGFFRGQIDNVVLNSFPTNSANLRLKWQGSQPKVNVAGSPGTAYTLWRTSRLSPPTWTNILSGTLDSGGHALLMDANPPKTEAFYRLTSP